MIFAIHLEAGALAPFTLALERNMAVFGAVVESFLRPVYQSRHLLS